MADTFRVEYTDLQQQAYHVLRQMILTGELAVGEKLKQDELAERLGVSRTPLLNAFSKLEKEMLVETLPRRGSYVRRYSAAELVQVYDIRLRLEPLAASEAASEATNAELAELQRRCDAFAEVTSGSRDEQAVKTLDYDLHMQIMTMSRNEVLQNMVSSSNIVIVANIYGLLKDPAQSHEEHCRIVAAISDRSPRRAMRWMHQHISNSRANLVRSIESGEFAERYTVGTA